MSGKEAFGVVVRTVGLLSASLGLFWFGELVVFYVDALVRMGNDKAAIPLSYAVVDAGVIFFGMGLMRWAHRIVLFAYDGASPLTVCVCGYDLRGTPDRCPECGRVPEVL